MRHTAEHDEWSPDGRCEVLIMEPDGTVSRCGYRVTVPAFYLGDEVPVPAAPSRSVRVARIVVATVVGLLGVAIVLDWLAFVLYVSRNEADPGLATAFLTRVAVSAAYGAGAAWLWRRS